MMSVRCRRQDQDTLFVKGAPEAVIACCSRVSQTCTPHSCLIFGAGAAVWHPAAHSHCYMILPQPRISDREQCSGALISGSEIVRPC